MRGLRRIGLLAISVVCVLAFTAVSAFADAGDELLTEKPVGGVLLRDVNTPSVNQPSAIELGLNGNLKWEIPGVATNECTEWELGSFVTRNLATTTNPKDELAVPFGVLENCTLSTGGNAPLYVDTEGTKKAASGLEVFIFDEAVGGIKAELVGLKLSYYIKGPPEVICKFTGTITGQWTNGAGPFTEEAATNQSMVDVTGQKLTSPTCGTLNITTTKFFVETTSDAKNFVGNTDTVFVNT